MEIIKNMVSFSNTSLESIVFSEKSFYFFVKIVFERDSLGPFFNRIFCLSLQ